MLKLVCCLRIAGALLLGMWVTSVVAGETLPPITAAAFTTDGKQVVIGSQAGIEIRNWPELEPVSKLKTKLSHVHALAISPDGKSMLAAGGHPAEEGGIEWYVAKSEWTLSTAVSVNEDVIYDVAVWGKGQAAIGGGDALVQVFHQGKLQQKLKGHSHPVLAVVCLPDGKTLVSAGIDQSLRVWDLKTGETKRTLAIHTAPVLGLAVRPGEQPSPHPYVASISRDRSVRLWQPTIGRMVRFARLQHVPLSVAWTPDGNHVVVGCEDGSVRVVDPDTVQVVAEHPAIDGWVHTLAMHPRRREVFAAGTGGALKRVVLEE